MDKQRRGLSWGFLTAGRVHYRPFVTAVIFPEIPYAKVMFWLFYPLLLIYFLKSQGKVVALPSPIIPTLCLAAPSEHHGVGTVFNGTQQVWKVLGSEHGVQIANRNPVFCLSIFQRDKYNLIWKCDPLSHGRFSQLCTVRILSPTVDSVFITLEPLFVVLMFCLWGHLKVGCLFNFAEELIKFNLLCITEGICWSFLTALYIICSWEVFFDAFGSSWT